MKKCLFIIMVMCIVFSITSPVLSAQSIEIKDVETKGVYIQEISTDTVVYENNSQEKYYPASITKLLTALTACDYVELNESITAGSEIYYISKNSSIANIKFGEKLSFLEYLYAMLLPSGNDAANVIAAYTAKKLDNSLKTTEEQIEYFATLMNKKAKEIGALNSNFVNPSGLHDDNHYTTAYDMCLIGKGFLNNETLAEIAAESTYTTDNKKHTWYSGNLLLHETFDNIDWINKKGANKYYCEYAKGLKTGSTKEAGRTIVAYFEKDDMKILSVILKSNDEDLFDDAIYSLNYVTENYKLLVFGSANEVLDKITILNNIKNTTNELEIMPEKNINILALKEEDDFACECVYDSDIIDYRFGKYIINEDILKGDIVGKAIVKNQEGNQVLSVNLIAGNSVLRETFYFEKYFCLAILFIILVIIFLLKKKNRGKHERKII